MPSAPKIALIAGAAGLVGSRLLLLLLADSRYGRVISIVRRPTGISHPKLDERRVDFERVQAALEGVEADDWFCTLGTTMKRAGSREAFRRVDFDYPLALGRMAKTSGAAQFLTVTAMGSSVSSPIFYSRVKGELERELAALNLERLHLFRPSLLLGKRQELRSGERAGEWVMKALHPLLRGPLRKYRAIAADAVAKAMVRASANSEGPPGVRIYESDKIEELASFG